MQNHTEREIPPPTGSVPEERDHLAAMVQDYQTMMTPRSFQYWLDHMPRPEADRMNERVRTMIAEEMARQSDADYDEVRSEVLFRVGWALGAAAARGVR